MPEYPHTAGAPFIAMIGPLLQREPITFTPSQAEEQPKWKTTVEPLQKK